MLELMLYMKRYCLITVHCNKFIRILPLPLVVGLREEKVGGSLGGPIDFSFFFPLGMVPEFHSCSIGFALLYKYNKSGGLRIHLKLYFGKILIAVPQEKAASVNCLCPQND
jgi:hypothetical protein